MTRIRAAIVASLAAALILTGCSDGDDDDDAATATTETSSVVTATTAKAPDGVDPCKLVTPAELQATFESPFDAGERTKVDSPMGGTQCTWTNTDPPPVKTFDVAIVTDADISEQLRKSGQTAEKLYNSTKDLSKDAEGYEELSGLGDDAFRSKTRVLVLRDGVQISFSTFLGDSPEATTGLKSLAAKAIARM